MHVPGRPVAAFDPEGLIFAAGINSESVKLYDLRSFDKVVDGVYLILYLKIHYRVHLIHLNWIAKRIVIGQD